MASGVRVSDWGSGGRPVEACSIRPHFTVIAANATSIFNNLTSSSSSFLIYS